MNVIYLHFKGWMLSLNPVTCKAVCSCRELDDPIECRVEKVRGAQHLL